MDIDVFPRIRGLFSLFLKSPLPLSSRACSSIFLDREWAIPLKISLLRSGKSKLHYLGIMLSLNIFRFGSFKLVG